eukprot:TRINITY_DN15846_c0_g1_i3.p1 TRINITY_DN15846_c0_g1~~TRINITY_DN15846_c0_g1_i3.p1  ORF type:complete len:248 (-),score=49.99 TRINITY_DN15846_c0_g1_i3:108-851(-)
MCIRDSSKVKHVAAAYFPVDFNVNAYKLTKSLIDLSVQKYGAKLLLNHEVKSFVFAKDTNICIGVLTNSGFIPADDVVISSGNGSKPLLDKLGRKIPMIAVKGYSLAIKRPAERPATIHNIYDEGCNVFVTSLGDEYRVSGCAEVAGLDYTFSDDRKKWLLDNTTKLVGNIDRTNVKFWVGHRPLSADSVPVIGAIPGVSRVWINSAHGAKGLGQCLGSGKLIKEIVLGEKTSLDKEDYSFSRFLFI